MVVDVYVRPQHALALHASLGAVATPFGFSATVSAALIHEWRFGKVQHRIGSAVLSCCSRQWSRFTWQPAR